MHSLFFEAWFENHLIPLLKQGTVIVMDNENALINIAKEHDLKIIFLPPYSPELNPIEHFGNWLKKKLLIYFHIFKNFDDVIYSIFKVL